MVNIPTGLLGSEQALRQALQGATNAVETGLGRATDINAPFAQGGLGAFDLQAALSGAQGARRQGQAFDNFQSSPGQQFLRDEAEQALLRNASAIGGLGGGRVREALQQNAIGLASQDFGNQFDRLGQVAGLGGQFAGNQAGMEFGAGNTVAQMIGNTGRDISAGRGQAGRDIATSLGSTTSALANLVNQQGSGLGDIISQGSGNLANILSGAGTAQLGSQTQLAELLAQLGIGQSSQISSLQGIPAVNAQAGSIGNIGQFLTGIGQLLPDRTPNTGIPGVI